jgi:hypothetical protein
MSAGLPPIQDFSKWDGTPFFKGYPTQGRRVYLVKTGEEGAFLAYGVVEPSPQYVFRVSGSAAEQGRFEAEMRAEGASITHGPPPFETQTPGDKPPTKDPSGAKGPGPRVPR